MLTIGSLFSGIGGFDRGLERAGMEVKWQVEIDDFCNKVLAKHWPEVKRYKDVRDFTVDTHVSQCYDQLPHKDREVIDMGIKRSEYDLAVQLYNQGLSIQDVADFYNITRQAMWMILKRRGCEFRKNLKYGRENHFYRGETTAPDRIHNLVELAIEKGILIRTTHCEKCNVTDTKINSHHDDYNKPLDVRWLCSKCHFEWHKNNKPVELKTVFSSMANGRKEVMPDEFLQKIESATNLDVICGGVP